MRGANLGGNTVLELPHPDVAVPGDVARVRQLADQLLAMAAGLRDAATLASGAVAAGWTGPAATAFAAVTHVDPEPYARAAAALGAAGAAVLEHAAVLARAKGLAAESLARARAAPPGDLGQAHREHAEQLLQLARDRVRRSGAETAEALRRAAQAAPDEPGFLGRQVAALRSSGLELATGVAQGVSGVALLARRLNPERVVSDPFGLAADVGALAEGTAATVAHPRATWSAAVEAAIDHPMRTLGAALPTLALGALTGGAGAAAGRGATLGGRLALLRAPQVTPGAARTLVRSVRDANRSAIRQADLRRYEHQAATAGALVKLAPVDHAVAQVLLRDAAAAEPRITRRVRRVAAGIGSDLLKPEHVRKGPDSLKRKLAKDMSASRQGAVVVAPTVGDSVRYAVAVPADVYVARTLAAVRAMRGEGFGLAAAKVRWDGTGYRGTNLTFRDQASGRLLELQIHTPQSWRASLATHDDYEIVRDEGRSDADRAAAASRVNAAYARVPDPRGIDGLKGRLPEPDVDPRSTRPPLHRLPSVRAGGAGGGAVGGVQGAAGADVPDGERAGPVHRHGQGDEPVPATGRNGPP